MRPAADRSASLSGEQHRKLAWGPTVGGLAAGLIAARTRCEADRPLSLSVTIMNAGAENLRLPPETSRPQAWRVELVPEGGGKRIAGIVSSAVRSPKPQGSIGLKPGQELKLALSCSEYSDGPRATSSKARKRSLAPGTYSVVAVFTPGPRGPGAVGLWAGRLSTARVRIEIALSLRQLEVRFKSLSVARDKAEAAFAAARGAARNRLYHKYVVASQQHIMAIVKAAESTPDGLKERKALGTRAAATALAWLKHQDDSRYRAPLEGVLMWMGLYTGRGLVCAGDLKKACAQGFDQTLKHDPTRFPRAAQPWAWGVNLRARLCKGLALAGDRQWKKSLGTIDPAFFFRAESRGRPLGIRARILMARCLGKLQLFEKSSEEFNRAFKEIEVLRARGGNEFRHADGLRRRAVLDMADMVVDAMKAGVKIRAKSPSR